MLTNKKKDMTPFDMQRPPVKQNPLLMPVVWSASWLMTRQFRLKIKKIGMKGLKPPYIVFSAHQGFSDYYILPLALFPHRANYVSDMEGFAAFGNGLYRAVGCIGKRRYVPDYSVIKNIKHAIKKKSPVVIFPESRHSNVGTTSYILDNLGKLSKSLGIPVVTVSIHGSYLANPFWDEEHTRKVPMEAVIECVCTKEKLKTATAEEIQRTIEEKLSYDEYRWQYENKISIGYKKNAEGLHKALYKCRNCGCETQMTSEDNRLFCKECNSSWQLSRYGRLECGKESVHIPDWYEWQRTETKKELEVNGCDYSFDVRVEALPNEKGFVPLGSGRLQLDNNEFVLEIENESFVFPHRIRESVQTEYNYRGRGQCIVLSTRDCCYYIYCDDVNFSPTKLQFIGEYYYQKYSKEVHHERM